MKATAKTAPESEGFKSYLYGPKIKSSRCFIVLLGDEGNDFMDKACARWLTEYAGCAALCLALRPEKSQNSGISLWPLENVEKALAFAKEKGFKKLGILGMSIQAAMALSAAARLPEIEFTLAISPCDFVPWGFQHGRIGKSSKGEWPSGESAFTWRGENLPFQSAGFEKDEYWKFFLKDKKKYGEMHTVSLFDESERRHPIDESSFIPVENIKGKLILAAAEDDAMWDAARYSRRMEKRLEEKGLSAEILIFKKGTHFIVPENMLKKALPPIRGRAFFSIFSGTIK